MTVAFVSGKGGVGKTMLSVAFAKELSLTNRTLIIDLDFFNRGLTGLMGTGIKVCDVERPSFLLDGSHNSADGEIWTISQVSDNLFHLTYPDLLPDEMTKFETLDIEVLKESFKQFIEELRKQCGCDCVVLDCHGGPDNASFAACLVADYSLLISEPDRITFYGTLNFLRQLQRVCGEEPPNLRLVFNKVVPAFSALFLRNLYNRLIRQHFWGRPLLAVFPLEVYLTKEFEKTPFLTAVYPKSWLAKKTQTMIYDLLLTDHPEKVSRFIASMPGWMRSYRKLSLGKPVPLLDLNFAISTIVACLVFMVLLNLTLTKLYAHNREALTNDLYRIHFLECLNVAPDLANDFETVTESLSSGERTMWLEWPSVRQFQDPKNRDRLYELDRQRENFQQCQARKTGEDGRFYYIYPEKLASLRKSALGSYDPNSVPSPYRNDYLKAIDGLKHVSFPYLSLERLDGLLQPIRGLLAAFAVGWLGIVLLANWSLLLDRKFTYLSRQGKHAHSIIPVVVAMAIWLLPLILLTSVVTSNVVGIWAQAGRTYLHWIAFAASILVALTPASFVVNELFDVYRDIRYERHYIEDGLKLLFVVYLVGVPLILFKFGLTRL